MFPYGLFYLLFEGIWRAFEGHFEGIRRAFEGHFGGIGGAFGRPFGGGHLGRYFGAFGEGASGRGEFGDLGGHLGGMGAHLGAHLLRALEGRGHALGGGI